jgi:uncharacterized protein (DUF1501 family)
MIGSSRRTFLKFAAAGAGTLLCESVRAAPTLPDTAEPHYFLLIFLGGGADASYLYDARPLSMSAAGRARTFLAEEPAVLRGRNGNACRTTRLAQPLARLRDRFSIINGVHMASSFDGHLQNVNLLLTGNPFGGESFVPHLNGATPHRAADLLDAIEPTNPIFSNISNHSRVVPLRPASVAGLATRLRQMPPAQKGDELMDFVRSRIAANAGGSGRLAAGAGAMLEGLSAAGELHRRIAQIEAPDPQWNAEEQSISVMAQCFSRGIARSAIYLVPEDFDVHSPDRARSQPQLFTAAVERVATLLDGLIETPYDSRRSLLDVTTVMVASEFSRTLRSVDLPAEYTGTHHNQLTNTILLGGKGIRPGMVIGESDLANETEAPSPAHLSLDPRLERPMGRPFDFQTLRSRSDSPQSFDIGDYLTIGSVVNTVYSLFDVPSERRRRVDRDRPLAPVLSGLLT